MERTDVFTLPKRCMLGMERIKPAPKWLGGAMQTCLTLLLKKRASMKTVLGRVKIVAIRMKVLADFALDRQNFYQLAERDAA